MGSDYIDLKEAARRSGLHRKTIQRLLRDGVLEGYKTSEGGSRRWLVSVASLRRYSDPWVGYLLDLPGPKLFLRRLDGNDDGGEW